MEKLNIDKIAKYAFVSRSVVSRVLNGHPNVSDSARERVQKVIKKYNYRRNTVARSLAINKTNEIGLITIRSADEVLSTGVSTLTHLGIFDECVRQGFFVRHLYISPDMKENYKNKILSEHQLEGFILLNQEANNLVFSDSDEHEPPAVLIGHAPAYQKVHSVDVDNYDGAYKATKHLIDLGYFRIGTMFGSLQLQETEDRLRGYMQAMLDAGYPVKDEQIVIGEYSQKSGFDIMSNWIRKGLELEAVFCASDTMAMGALSALQEHGRKVPGDMAVIGFDDHPLSNYTIPPLTTIRQPIYRKGQRAAELLIQKIYGNDSDVVHENLDSELIIRRSCGYPFTS